MRDLSRLCSGNAERFNTKSVCLIRVFQDGSANVLVTDDATNARQGHIEPRGLRQLWREETELNLADATRFCFKRHGKNCLLWRMRFEIEVKKFEPDLFVGRRQRRPNSEGA